VFFEVDAIIKELRAAMFLTGADCILKLSDVEWDVVGADLWI